MEIKDLIYKTEKVDWRKLNFTQPDSLKKISKKRMNMLKESLRKNDFIMSFFGFEKDGKQFVIDGHNRFKALKEIEGNGGTVPEKLTCSFIKYKDDEHLKKIILAFSSPYSEYDDEGLMDFISDLDLTDLTTQFDLGFKEERKTKKKKFCQHCGEAL